MSSSRPINELAPAPIIEAYRQEITQSSQKEKSEKEMDAAMRSRLDAWHLELFNRTQAETTKRWTYESEIKRPYYHVTDLDDQQLANWRKYLDFEEAEGDYIRTKFLYERCLVTTANYEEFWLRYARWMFAQPGKPEEVRNIYQRASCLYIPIAQPTIRLFYAQFEEAEGRPDTAAAIHEAILDKMPGHIETIISLANVHRRQYGVPSAIETLKTYTNDAENSIHTRGALASEWARMVWMIQGDVVQARQIYVERQQAYLESQTFWVSWLEFEMQQSAGEREEERLSRVRGVFEEIRAKSRLSPDLIRDLSIKYFAFLRDCGGKDAMKEFMQLDREINGSASVAGVTKQHSGKDAGPTTAGSELDAAHYYAMQQTGIPVNGSQAAH